MKWITFVIPVFLWGQSFFGNFSSGFISRMGRRNQNQPASSFELRFTGGFNFHGISAGINLYFNSEDKFTPQATSFYSLTPTWSWGKMYIGTFSPSFSPLTLSGITLTGGGIEVFPGIFKLFIVTGRVKKASTDSTGPSYERFLWGIRIGLGKLTGTRITLVNSKDIVSSVNDSVLRSHGVYPQENWVLEVGQRLAFFGGKFRISGVAAVTLFTRDILAGGIEINRIPGWVKKNFRINSSTHADYAYRAEASLSLKKVRVDYRHTYAGPGYEAHGISSRLSDRIEDATRINLQIIPGSSAGISYSQFHDNVIDTRNGTSTSRTATLYLSLFSTSKVSFLSTATFSYMEKTGEVDTFNIKNNTLSVNSGIMLRVSRSVNFRLSGNHTEVKTRTYSRNLPAGSNGISLTLNHHLTRFLSYGAGYSLTNTRSDTLTGIVHSPSLLIRLSFTRLNLDFSAKAGISEKRTMFNLGFSGGVKITQSDIVSFKLTSTPEHNRLEFRAFYARNFRFGS